MLATPVAVGVLYWAFLKGVCDERQTPVPVCNHGRSDDAGCPDRSVDGSVTNIEPYLFVAADFGINPEEVTFTKDIAPILQRSCQNCHRAAGGAPMALTTYPRR